MWVCECVCGCVCVWRGKRQKDVNQDLEAWKKGGGGSVWEGCVWEENSFIMIFLFYSESISAAFSQGGLYGRYSIIRGEKGRGEKMEGGRERGRNGDGYREGEGQKICYFKIPQLLQCILMGVWYL